MSKSTQEGASVPPVRIGRCEIHGPHAEAEAIAAAYANRAITADKIESAEGEIEDLRSENRRLRDHIDRLGRVIAVATEL